MVAVATVAVVTRVAVGVTRFAVTVAVVTRADVVGVTVAVVATVAVVPSFAG